MSHSKKMVKPMYTMKQLIKDIHALADALNIDENRREVEFTHESGFNSVQGKYSLVCNTRGLLIASEDAYERDTHKEVKEVSENALRYNEYGDLVFPPKKPNPPKALKTDRWKSITEKRMEKIYQHEVDKEGYEIALAMYHMKMQKWLELPTSKKTKLESIYEDYEKMGRVLRGDKGFVFLDVLPKPFTPLYKVKISEVGEEDGVQRGKPNLQTTLDGLVRYAPPLRVVDFDIITSFGVKPNFLLEKEWLLHILNGEKLSETSRQFLMARKEEGRKMRGF